MQIMIHPPVRKPDVQEDVQSSTGTEGETKRGKPTRHGKVVVRRNAQTQGAGKGTEKGRGDRTKEKRGKEGPRPTEP